MSVQIRAERDETVPLQLAINRGGVGGVSGLAPTVRVRDAGATGSYLDWADFTFKTSGWTLQNHPMSDIGSGVYALPAGLPLAAVTNLPTAQPLLIAEYLVTITGPCPETPVAIDVISLSEVCGKVEELLQLEKYPLRVNLATQQLELLSLDETTVIQCWPIFTEGGEPVNTQFGVQIRKGAPKL